MIIKYKIRKDKKDGYGGSTSKQKVIKKSELKQYKTKGWYVVQTKYIIITAFKKWWNKFTNDNKINILSFTFPLFATIFLVLNYQANNKINTLNEQIQTLNQKDISSNERIIYLLKDTDKLNKAVDSLSLEFKTRNVSDKKVIE